MSANRQSRKCFTPSCTSRDRSRTLNILKRRAIEASNARESRLAPSLHPLCQLDAVVHVLMPSLRSSHCAVEPIFDEWWELTHRFPDNSDFKDGVQKKRIKHLVELAADRARNLGMEYELNGLWDELKASASRADVSKVRPDASLAHAENSLDRDVEALVRGSSRGGGGARGGQGNSGTRAREAAPTDHYPSSSRHPPHINPAFIPVLRDSDAPDVSVRERIRRNMADAWRGSEASEGN